MAIVVGLLLRDVTVGAARVDVRVREGRIASIGVGLDAGGDEVRVGGGGALIAGLHDHHIHLLATAAADESVDVGPPAVRTRAELAAALSAAPPADGWVRAVNYDESVAGLLDRSGLDALRDDVAVRIQHRSGALWIVNSQAIAVVDANGPGGEGVLGIERDSAGRATGRIWREDGWLGSRMPAAAPDLSALGTRLASLGITAVTDATPSMSVAALRLLGELPQRVTVLAADVSSVPPPLTLGPAKLVLADHALPGWDELVASIGAARAAGRAVAVHSVTRESLLLVLAVLAEVGVVVGDRIEHAAVAPAEAIVQLARLGVAVVTQPSLVARRGEQYRDRVDAKDRPWLWPYGSLLSAGIAVSPSSDAPYGDLDPWAGIRAARDRTTSVGRTLGSGERVEAATALRGYLASSPGQRPREVAVGEPADLVLLDAPLPEVLADPAAERVRATLIGGRVRHG